MKLTVPGAEPKPEERAGEYTRCGHPSHTVCRRTQSNGVVVVVRQCRTCGSNMGAIPKAGHSVDTLPVFDEEKQKAWWAEQSRKWSDEKDSERQRFQRWYADYLLSSKWREKRQATLNRDQHLCQGCRAAKAAQVHHLTYERVGRELLIDLVSLCDVCHEAVHTK